MPRKAKDEINLIEEKKETGKTKTTKKTTATASAKVKKEATVKKSTSTAKKTTAKKATVTSAKAKKEATTKETASVAKKATTKKTTSAAKTAATRKTTSTKVKKETAVKKATSTTKKTTTRKTSTTRSKKVEKVADKKVEILEYYDLPYRYNQTVVKVLAQTPNILFVYWDISDEDKESYIKSYGEYFFNDTTPILIIHNNTLNYSFEIEINDFANSWYLHIEDANCDYTVELGRRPKNNYAKIDSFMHIFTSNKMDAPNDHILFDSLNNNVYFRNVKTSQVVEKNISLSFLTRIGKLYNVKEFYKTLYKDEAIDFERLNLKNMPSS